MLDEEHDDFERDPDDYDDNLYVLGQLLVTMSLSYVYRQNVLATTQPWSWRCR